MGTLVAPLLWRKAFPSACPKVHDEYMHLLVGETLASGRLANPPHPFWKHLQAVYVLQQPAYASPYQPGFGAILGLSQRLTGRPIAGVWLAASLMCASILWMLYGYVSPPFAVLGVTLAVARLWTSYWTDSYWGGALAAAAGALLFGAIPRALRDRRYGFLWLVPFGGSILWLTRPFDTAVLALFLLVSGSWWLHRSTSAVRRAALRHLIPATILIAGPCLVFTARYNRAVTGSPFTVPYQGLLKAQGVPTRFFWQPQEERRHFDDRLIDSMYEWHWLGEYDRSPGKLAAETARRVVSFGSFYFGPLLGLCVAALLRLRVDPYLRFAGLATLVGFLASSLYPFAPLHYLALYSGVIVAICAASLAQLGRLRDRRGRMGLAIVGAVVAMELGRGIDLLKARSIEPWGNGRSEVEARLLREGGQHLVFVRYAPGHSFHDEWRYNHADIDGSPIVWASEIDPASDRAMIDYFRGRRVWVVDVVDRKKAGTSTVEAVGLLSPYTGPPPSTPPQTSRLSASFARSVMKR